MISFIKYNTFLFSLLSTGVVAHWPVRDSVAEADASDHLLQLNKQWAANVTKADSTFFTASSKAQDPKVLWIGCSDSRVPESVITQSLPGDIFTDRNIANQIPSDDANAVAVLEYAVEHLSVEHVVVVGHSKCGGAAASLAASQSKSPNPSRTLSDKPASNPINKWLKPLTELALSLKPWLATKTQDEALQALIEENVRRQVASVSKNDAVNEAWKEELSGKGRKVRVHGWVYDLSTGLLRDLNVTRGPLGRG